MISLSSVIRFLFVVIVCAIAFSLLARVIDDSDDRWSTGAAVWGASLGLAAVDAYFRGNEKLKG